jgi:pyrimidine deaminase RibD-like protein
VKQAEATAADRQRLREAIELARHCPVVSTAYAVGAVVVGADGRQLACGYSRESHPADHAEEVALAKLSAGGLDLSTVTIYSSLEPCSIRKSRSRTCSQLIIQAGIRRVVFALREPPFFADCHGVEVLQNAGIDVVEIDDMGAMVWEVNWHLVGRPR